MRKIFVERKSDRHHIRMILAAAVASVAMAGEVSAQSSLDQGLDPLAATTMAAIAAEEPRQGRELTDEQEEALALRFEVLERAVESNHTGCQSYEHILGRNRCRDLNRALFDYNLNRGDAQKQAQVIFGKTRKPETSPQIPCWVHITRCSAKP